MAEPAGERRIITVLMADVAGSTAIGETLGPERSKFLFDDVVRLMGEEVRRFGGTVAQLTGDGLFALFGAPAAHEDDSERAVRAALAIHESLHRFAAEVEEAYGVSVTARVAVNTGPVVLTSDDAPLEERYNALGDTVNVAARLQALAGEGGVAVGPMTAHQVEGRFAIEPLGEFELKGKGVPVAAFRVEGERAEEQEAPARTRFVGREAELAELQEALAGVLDGRGAVVSVIGEPGIGKSRLVLEARERYAGRVRFLEGHAVSYAEGLPYWPVRDLLRSWLRLGSDDSETRSRIELKAALAPLLDDAAAGAYPFLANLLGLASDPEVAETLREFSRDSVQRQTHDAVFDLVRALAREQPACLVLEDLHWADEPTLELIEHLLPLVEEEALCALLLYRSDPERPAWQLGELARRRYRHRYSELELGPLERGEALALAGAELPRAAAELLLDHTGGNPFFLEEALRDLVERGALRRENGRYELAVGVDELAVPTLVQEALQARLDRLSPETRDLATVASVVGRTFGLPLLERLAPRETLVPALSELQRLELVVEERRRPAPEYRFRHGLVREAAYASLTEGRRRALHRSVGEALEELHSEELAEAYGLLARHFTEADEPERAADYLLGAGDAARSLYADSDAIAHYRRALSFLDRLGDSGRARRTLFKIALTHHLAFDFEAAGHAYEEAFARRAADLPRMEPTKRVATAMWRPESIVPGETYSHMGWMFAQHVFRGLLALDRELNVVPDLAESFRISEDGLTYSFRLDPRARWSDGEAVTAGDFVFAWSQNRRTGFMLEDVDAAEAIDERTLDVRLREPRNYFPYILALPPSFPWPRHLSEAFGDDWSKPAHLVGNGPFVLGEYGEQRAVLQSSPTWAGPRGNVAVIDIAFREDEQSMIEAWSAGAYDVLFMFEAPPGEAADTITESIPGMGTNYIGFRADVRPFDDARVRKAFSHAIDREGLAKLGPTQLQPAVRGGFIPPAMPAHAHRAGLEYDLKLARSLLAEAGYTDGRGLPALELAVPFGDVQILRHADAVCEQWAALGAQVTARVAAEMTDGTIPETAHTWMFGWIADYPDPRGMLASLMEMYPSLYSDSAIRDLLERARSLRDQDERMHTYQEIERLWISEQGSLLPVFYHRNLLFRRPWVEGAWASPVTPLRLDEAVLRR